MFYYHLVKFPGWNTLYMCSNFHRCMFEDVHCFSFNGLLFYLLPTLIVFFQLNIKCAGSGVTTRPSQFLYKNTHKHVYLFLQSHANSHIYFYFKLCIYKITCSNKIVNDLIYTYGAYSFYRKRYTPMHGTWPRSTNNTRMTFSLVNFIYSFLSAKTEAEYSHNALRSRLFQT